MPRVFDRNNPPACVRLPARPSATIFTFPAAGADGAAANVAGPHPAMAAAAMATPGGIPTACAAPHEPEACGLRDLHASGAFSGASGADPHPRHDVIHLGVGYAIGQLMTVAGILLCIAPGQELDVLAGAGTGLAVIVTVLAFVIGADRYAAPESKE